MNKIALFFFFLFLFFKTNAQDHIVSIKHDTIRCKITSITKDRINYEVKGSNGLITGKFINLLDVAEYTLMPQTRTERKLQKLRTPLPDNLWNVSLSIGGSTMPWYFDDFDIYYMPQDYYDSYKRGFHVNASAHFLLNNSTGVGIEYSHCNSSFEGVLPTQYISSIYLMVSEKNRHYINYLGPSVNFRQLLGANQRFLLSETFSTGVLFYRLESQTTYPEVTNSGYTEINSNLLLHGTPLALKLGITAEYALRKNLSIGLGGDFFGSLLERASFESKSSNNNSILAQNQQLSNSFNLSRIDYSLVFRYHF